MKRIGLWFLGQPEGLLRVEAALEDRGYPPEAVTAILGGNFRRVAAEVWGRGV